MRKPGDLHPPSNSPLHPGPKASPRLSQHMSRSLDQPCPSHKHQIHMHPFAFQASAQQRPLLSTQGSVEMPKVPRKQFPDISQGVCVIPPCPRTDNQKGLLPAPLEAQGLQEQRALLLPDTPRGAGRLIYYCCALG